MADPLGLTGLVISANLFLARTVGKVALWLTVVAVGLVLILLFRYTKKKR